MRIKYLATYWGPSYFSIESEYMMGFTSLRDAGEAFGAMQHGSAWYTSFRENVDGYYVIWENSCHALTPGTTDRDCMYLYHAAPSDGGVYVSGELAYVLSIGPRKGIVVERA